ncbi:LysR family transcriptional regulator [Rouxiella sp. S1S-2]|uniref:LysR substrate-binding domain-containing protein n=1 Tax=Rouxiella sp. S1S-2 TaxID=2653856 RepID=UPI001264DCC9|nr:LysR substrate-binding domain-containing protein [Rouxiella sp. S1S-2]KAB7895655.1 LysR family transcriptional regulator [Rouxiella sp. S1S-2]
MAKRPLTFDAEALRSFVTGIELGSFVLAAERLGRSTSAISAQLKKLEQQAGAALVQKSGRHLALTERGEILLGYARRLLSLNDEACAAMTASAVGGEVRLGLQEDFGEVLLPAILGKFARAHPNVQISASVSRNLPLLTGIKQNELDLALSWQSDDSTPFSQPLGKLPLRWIGDAQFNVNTFLDSNTPLPLLVFEAPCIMRNAATAALDRAGIPWRIAFTSRSLGGIWAAATAGLGITLRTEMGMPAPLRYLEASSLPEVGDIGIMLHQSTSQLTPATDYLQQTIRELFPLQFSR